MEDHKRFVKKRFFQSARLPEDNRQVHIAGVRGRTLGKRTKKVGIPHGALSTDPVKKLLGPRDYFIF
jgi:hypothetical protein